MLLFGILPAAFVVIVLDLHRLHTQFDGFQAYQVDAHAQRATRLQQALDAFAACGTDWEALRDRDAKADPSWLIAGLREDPTRCCPPGTRPTPLTVVAADGSQIFPDRHIEPHCYLLNVSRIAFQYGTAERPLIEAVPEFRYRREEFEDEFGEILGGATAEVVSALRDEMELQALLATALEARLDGRPLVALADGTLIRWMLRRMQNHALEKQLIARYTAILDDFRQERIPLASYISMPGNTEVVNLLRLHRGEHEGTPPDASLAGIPDRWLFERTLPPGERSAVFVSSSRIQREYGAADQICYFYVCIPASGGAEIGRVEVPTWVADDPALLELIHTTVLSECRKGEGYPMILQEAHEQAVIRAREKELFYQLVEQNMLRGGLPFSASQKQASKRRPMV